MQVQFLRERTRILDRLTLGRSWRNPFRSTTTSITPSYLSLWTITIPIFIFALFEAFDRVVSPVLFPHSRILPSFFRSSRAWSDLAGWRSNTFPVLLPRGGALSDAAVEVLIHVLSPLASSALQLHPLHVLPSPSRFLPRTSHPHLSVSPSLPTLRVVLLPPTCTCTRTWRSDGENHVQLGM